MVLLTTRYAGKNVSMSDHAAPPRGRLRERTAEEIRVHLARRRMSAAELARRTGLKQPYVSRRMTGEIAFDLDDLEVIARELGVTVAELIAGEGEQTTAAKLHLTARPTDPAERPKTDRPRDNRPSGRPGRSAPSPTTRRPARVS